MAKQDNILQARQTYARFPVLQRIEHIVLIASFTTLAVTGLVQKFAGNTLAESIIGALGGIENVRTIHHIAAIVFALESIYHVILLAHKVYVRRVEMSMLPGLKDAVDAIDVVRYNLGLTHEHPKMPRYNFAEKMEYWALAWGAIMMGLTGFMLWNPIAVTRFLPGQIIPAAKAAHGGEAILAVLAILLWHFYSVHLKTFNKSMFTGKMSRHQMEEEHGHELANMEAGLTRPPADPEGVRQRERVFMPVAIVSATVLTLVIIWFLTFESTAVATLPPAQQQAFVPLTPTPTQPATAERNASLGAPMPHPIEGQEQCDTCHGPAGVKPYPENHAGRPNESCTVCHQPGTAAGTGEGTIGPAPAIPHAVEGREGCDLCHGAAGSLMPLPASHEGRTVETCTMCHKPAEGAAVSEAAMPKPIPHSITEAAYEDCTVCHGPGKMKPAPENHATFTTDSCTICHQAATATETPAAGTEETTEGGAIKTPKPIPHSITDAVHQDCTICHGAGTMKPAPESHANFAPGSCTTCHTAAEAGATPAAAMGPMIPHSVIRDIFKDCTACHGQDKPVPVPASHASYTPDTCTGCHQLGAVTLPGPVPTVQAGMPKPIPHGIVKAIYQDCSACHGLDKPVPYPENHAAFPVSTCAGCHQPAAQ